VLLHEYLQNAAGLHPKKTALVAGEQRWTYHALDEKVSALAAHLLRRGMVRGDRVAVYLENSAEQVIAIFGILRAGGCIVVVNPTTQVERLGFIISHCEARYLFAPLEKHALVMRALEQSAVRPEAIWVGGMPPDGNGMLYDDLLKPAAPIALPRVIDEDLACIVYTSGSTGKPKGVTHLHRTIDVGVDSIIEYLKKHKEI